MKKLVLACLFIFCITFSCAFAATSVEFSIDSKDYYVQSGEVTKNTALAAPYIKNGRTMVPVRALCEAFGSTVGWNDETRTVTVSKGETSIALVIGSDKITVNGEEKTLDCPAEIVSDITFIPLRAVSENLGYFVYYIDSTRQILLDDTPAVLETNSASASFSEALNLVNYYTLTANEAGDISTARREYINSAYSLLKETSILSSYAIENNITLTAEEKRSFEELKNEIQNDSLMNTKLLSSAMIKFEQSYALAYKYATSIAQSIEASDEDAKKYYEENYVCAKHVLVGINNNRTDAEALKLAKEVYAKALKGEDFDLLVETYGEDPGMAANPSGYVFTKGEMVLEFEKASFDLKAGEISAPVKTSFGYHIIKKQPLPDDESYINIAKQALLNEKYAGTIQLIYALADVKLNISEADFLSITAQ